MAYDRTWPLYIILDSFEGSNGGGNHSPPLNGSWNDCTTSSNNTTTTNGHHPQQPTTPEHEVHHHQNSHSQPQPQSFCIKVRGDYSIGQVMVATTNAIRK